MNTLNKFNSFKNEICANNSRNYKLEILRKYANDSDIKYYLNFIYNPYITTGISDKKLAKDVTLIHNQFSNVYELLEYIKINNTGKDSILSAIHSFELSLSDPNLIILLDSIICKDIQLGVDVSSINKAMDNYIPKFSVQLANKYFDKPEVVKNKYFSLTTKIDGGRIIAKKKNGKINFFTRTGQPYEGLVDLDREFSENFPDNICLDGEITLLDPKGLSSKDQYKQTMMITRRDGEKHGVKMLVFDYMTADDFENQSCNMIYTERRSALDDLFSNNNSRYFTLLPILYSGNDESQILKWLEYNVDNGEEGVMININDALYDFKRTNNLLKVKKFNSMELRVIGFEEGTGKNKDSLGALLVKYKDNNIVKVGSGLSDELRDEIWKNKDFYVNKIAEIGYFEETENQNGGKSLRFPTFKDFRFDKLESDF